MRAVLGFLVVMKSSIIMFWLVRRRLTTAFPVAASLALPGPTYDASRRPVRNRE